MRHHLLWLFVAGASALLLAACSDEAAGGDGDDADLAGDFADDFGDLDRPDEGGAGDVPDDAPPGDLPPDEAPDEAGDDTAGDVEAGDDASPDGAGDTSEHDADASADALDLGTDAEVDAGPLLPDEPVYAPACRPRTPGRPASNNLVLHPILASNPWIRAPVQVLSVPDGTDRLIVVDQDGHVVITDAAPTLPPGVEQLGVSLWLNWTNRVSFGGEKGLLSLAFHPEYVDNGEIFLNYNPPGANRTIVSRLVVTEDGLPDPASEDVLLDIDQDFSNHNGGLVRFGPDGFLYIGMGDGGSGNDPNNRAQDPQSLLGKMLRIDVDSTTGELPYGIPADNPFVGDDGTLDEIYALGLRNPWRWSFDSVDGTLWLGDVGQNAWEEIDIIEPGGNYGWRIMEGNVCNLPPDCDPTGLELPVHVYGHSLGNAVTGGYVYRGSLNEELVGSYIFGDYGSGRIWALHPEGDDYADELLRNTSLLLSSFGEDANGELYATDLLSDQVYLLEYRVDPGAPPAWYATLSATGCLGDDAANAELVDGTLAYTVNHPFWSDGADKERALALPEGATIGFDEAEPWAFPDRTVAIKTFRLGGQLVETRLLTREAGEWLGATYQWLDDGEAYLVEEPTEITLDDLGGQTWLLPSPEQCERCHTPAAGYLLGLRTPQLNINHDVLGLGVAVNQIEALSEVGYFAGDPVIDAAALPRLPAVDDPEASLTDRARAYLDVNCSNCHRPGGPTPTSLDLRNDTALPDLGACDEVPLQGDLGIENARLIAPGEASRSVVWRRIDTIDEATRMPQLGRYTTDTVGSAVIEAWIDDLTGCGD